MLLETPLVLVLIFFSVVCHEIAHGLMAWKLGDPTAWRMGRLSFNPLVHIDIFGTILLPLFLLLMGSRFLFAWAKPVPVNPAYFRNRKQGMMLVALAGPATNLALAVAMSLLLKFGGAMMPAFLARALATTALMNVILMAFNLIPIPPLDGSRILANFLGGKLYWNYMRLERYGMMIVFGLLFLGVISRLLYPVMILGIRFLGITPYFY
ncbi:MAG: site-2 protease family protein [Candidatus Fermentibacteraceae bacterium]